MHIARSITANKWRKRKIGRQKRVPADGITSDLRVQGDCLSFWECDPQDEESLKKIVLALAAARDNIDRLDLVWIETSVVVSAKAKITPTPGETPAIYVKDKHRDVTNLGLTGTAKLASGIGKAVNGSQTRRWSKATVQNLLLEASKNSELDLDNLKQGIHDKLKELAGKS